MKTYRSIYIDHYGSIPVDVDGRTYDIHHIDGDKTNNDISNLIALSIDEHLEVHKQQGDHLAVLAIMLRLNKTPQEISEAASNAAKYRVEHGSHHWVGGRHQKELAAKLKSQGLLYFDSEEHRESIRMRNKTLSDQGLHNFQTDENKKKVTQRNIESLNDGSHPFLNGAGATNSRERVENGSHQFLNSSLQKELSERAKKKNSYIIHRIDSDGNITEYIGISDAVRDNPGSSYRRIQKATKNSIEYLGYIWTNLGKRDAN